MDAIDSLKFAREKLRVRGALPVTGFERLSDSLFPGVRGDDSIDFDASGDVDARQQPMLRLKISGRLPLQCQRCLGEYMHALTIDTVLRLVPAASLDVEQSDDPGEPDCIAASTELDLAVLIEDEILLALPAYPRHETRSCGGAGGNEAGKKVSAFSVLRELGAPGQKAFKSKE